MARNLADSTNNGASTVAERVQDYAATAIDTGKGYAARGRDQLDRVFPPEKREALASRLQTFAQQRPRLAAFLATHAVLSGVPILLLILFTIATFLGSVLIALIVAILAAVSFTCFSVGIALLIVVPTVFFTTSAACFLFFWGLIGYHLLRRAGFFENAGAQENSNGSAGIDIPSKKELS